MLTNPNQAIWVSFAVSSMEKKKKSLILKYYSSMIRNTQNYNDIPFLKILFVIYKINITEKVVHHTQHSVCESVENY